MNPVPILLIIAVGVLWIGSLSYVNDEIQKLQRLAYDDDAQTRFDLKAPNWAILRKMSQYRFWVVTAFIVAPILLIAWGVALIIILIFVLIPSFAWETLNNVWWSITHRSSHN